MIVRQAARSDMKTGNHFFYRATVGNGVTLLPTVVILGFVPHTVDKSGEETCVCLVQIVKMFHPANDKMYLGEILLAAQDQLLVADEFIGVG